MNGSELRGADQSKALVSRGRGGVSNWGQEINRVFV